MVRFNFLIHVAILHSRFKRGFLYAGFHDALGKLATSAALTGNTQFPAHFFKGAGARIHKFLDLAVCYSFAKTYVHGVYEVP